MSVVILASSLSSLIFSCMCWKNRGAYRGEAKVISLASIQEIQFYVFFFFFFFFFCNSPAKQTEIDVEGTVLLLSVFGHEAIGANDFAGMCVVACKDIPQLISSEAMPSDPDAPQRKNLTLPLFRYTSETPAFAELDARVREGDEKASNFFKVNKMLLGHLLHLRHGLPGLTKGLSGK